MKREKESKGVRAAERVSASKGGKNKGGRASKREVSELEKKEDRRRKRSVESKYLDINA